MRGEVLAHGWGVVIDVDSQAAIDRIAVGVGDGVVKCEDNIVFFVRTEVPNGGILSHAVCASLCIERDCYDGNCMISLALFD